MGNPRLQTEAGSVTLNSNLNHAFWGIATDKCAISPPVTMHDIPTSTPLNNFVAKLPSSPQAAVYPRENQQASMPMQMDHSPISDEETCEITDRLDRSIYDNIHSIRSLNTFRHYSPIYHYESELSVPDKPRSKSETDKESVLSPLWRLHVSSEINSFPFFKPLSKERQTPEHSPVQIDEDIKFICQSPSSMSKSSEGSSTSKEGESFSHGEGEGAKSGKSQKHPHQSFKKILRARYLSSQESTEGLSDIETSKDDDAVFEMDIHEEQVVYKTIPENPEHLRSKAALGAVPGHDQREPLDLSRSLAVFQPDLPTVCHGQAVHRFMKYQESNVGVIVQSEMTAVSPVPISPRWRKPLHSHIPSPLVTSSTLYSTSSSPSTHHLIPSAIHTTSQQVSPGLSPISPRYSPGRSPTFPGYMGGLTPSPSPQEVARPSTSDLPKHTKSSQFAPKFIFPPPSDMLEGRPQTETKAMFACPICTQVFPSYDNLAKHMAKHLPTETVRGPDNSKIHYCKVCNRAFSRSDMLTRHMRLHTGLKPYECKVCGQVFSRSDHLNTHQRTHTGEKPYHCPQCPYAACRRDMITRHMRIHLKRWTKRSPFSSSSSEESPRQWSLSTGSRSSSESAESHGERLLSGSSTSVESDRLVSMSSLESTDPSPKPSCSISSGDSVEMELASPEVLQHHSWVVPLPRVMSSDLGEYSDSTLHLRSVGSTTSSGTWASSASLSSDNNNASSENVGTSEQLPEHFQKCSVEQQDFQSSGS